MLFHNEAQANTAAATEVNYSKQNYSRTRTVVALVHNRSKILHLNLNALSFQSGGIAKHTSRGSGLYPCYEIPPNSSMVFVATAKQVSMFTGVCGTMQYHGRFVRPHQGSGPAPPSAFHDRDSSSTTASPLGPSPVELGISLDMTFNNPYAGTYKSFAEATPIRWQDPGSISSPGKAPEIGNLDKESFENYIEMMHEAGGSFCVPLPRYAEELYNSDPKYSGLVAGGGGGGKTGSSMRYLRIGYLPVDSMQMQFIIEDALFDFGSMLKSIPKPHMPRGGRVVRSGSGIGTGTTNMDSQASPEDRPATTEENDTANAEDQLHCMSFRVVEYNAFLRPNMVSYDGQGERAKRIPDRVMCYSRKELPLPSLSAPASPVASSSPQIVVHTGWKDHEEEFSGGSGGSGIDDAYAATSKALALNPDVVVMCEVFTLQDVIAENFAKHGLIYHTGKLSCNAALINGGVQVYSKYPIVDAKSFVFPGNASTHSDYLSAKGVVYTKIRKSVALDDGRAIGKDLHLFATHLQAWGSEKANAARNRQLQLMRMFTRRLHLTPTDAVVYAGDFNVPRRDPNAFEALSDVLGTYVPSFAGGAATVTPQNDLAGRDGGKFIDEQGEWLDYILSSREHCPPMRYLLEALKPTDAVVNDGSFDPSRVGSSVSPSMEASMTPQRQPSTTDFVDCDKFLNSSMVRNYKVPNSLCNEVLLDFKADLPFTVQWNRWKSSETKIIQDLSDHYPTFSEVEVPLFTKDWNLTAEGEQGEREFAKNRHMYFRPEQASDSAMKLLRQTSTGNSDLEVQRDTTTTATTTTTGSINNAPDL